MHFRDISGLALSGALLLSSVAMATETVPQKIKPDPDKIVQQMCGYLNSLNQFSFRAEVTDDQVYSVGKKLQYTFDTEIFVQRPDKLRVNARGDLLDIERCHHIRRRLVDDARAQPVLVAQNRQRRHLHDVAQHRGSDELTRGQHRAQPGLLATTEHTRHRCQYIVLHEGAEGVVGI